MEDKISTKEISRAPFEISLLLLHVGDFEEVNISEPFDWMLEPGVTPIVHEFTLDGDDDPSLMKYYSPKLKAGAIELTNEVEAFLVRKFQPKYNEILFNNYPNIKKGTRSAGYTKSDILIDQLPVILRTDYSDKADIESN